MASSSGVDGGAVRCPPEEDSGPLAVVEGPTGGIRSGDALARAASGRP